MYPAHTQSYRVRYGPELGIDSNPLGAGGKTHEEKE